jgi:beta-phosphoglucomutase-like phosphatase (HAD superfamily)
MGSPRLRELFHRIETTVSRGLLPLVVFDLDSTLFSTAPRNLRILREFVATHGERWPRLGPAVASLSEDDMGWNVYQSLQERGLGQAELISAIKTFWFDRFFTDEYVLSDTETPGAADYVSACHARGALIYYLTGRHVGGMEVGTVASLRRAGFPFWRGRCVLHLKPSFEMADKAFKDDAVADIRSYRGEVVGTFENEPGNANLFRRAFPGGLHFLLETIHSPEAETPDPELIRTADFVLGSVAAPDLRAADLL